MAREVREERQAPREGRPLRELLEGRLGAAAGATFHRALHGLELAGLPRFHLDRYGPSWVATFAAPPALDGAAARELASLLAATAEAVVFRFRDETRKGRALARVVAGTCPERLVVEHAGYRFEARPLDEIDPGAYPDTEPLRVALRAEAPGRRVLNLFAFTCLNGVVARVAGARSVVNVDLARSHLERGKANYALNELSVDDRDFVAEDALRFCAKAERGRWDLVIVDPPPMIRSGKGHVACEEKLEGLLRASVPLVARGGALHFLQCTARLTADELGARVRAACPGAAVSVIAPAWPALGADELPPTFKDAVVRIE